MKIFPLVLPPDVGIDVAESGVDNARSLVDRNQNRIENSAKENSITNHSGPKFKGCEVCWATVVDVIFFPFEFKNKTKYLIFIDRRKKDILNRK